jgi:CheY-like chemotaxis protein
MGGVEATTEIRAREHLDGRHLPIVAMTAQADTRTLQSCLAAGMDAYLAKPFQAESLIHLVEALFFLDTTESDADLHSQECDRDVTNLQAALERVNGDRQFFREMSGVFLTASPRLTRRIRDAIDAGDLKAAGIAAHALKNWASGFVAPDVHRAAEIVERQLDAGSMNIDINSCANLERLVAQLSREIERFSDEPVG